LWVDDLGCSSIVYEPIKMTGKDGFNAGSGQTLLGVIEDIGDHIDLFLAGSDENDSGCMVNDGESKSDSFGWGFGRIVDVSDPSVFLCEEFMGGKERCGVAIGAHTKENEVKYGETSGVLLCKLVYEFLLIRVGEFFEVVEECGIDGVDVLGGDGDF